MNLRVSQSPAQILRGTFYLCRAGVALDGAWSCRRCRLTLRWVEDGVGAVLQACESCRVGLTGSVYVAAAVVAGGEEAVGVNMVFSQDKVLQHFVEQIIVDSCWAWTGFNSASWSRTSKRSASVSDAGLQAPFSVVIKFVPQFSLGNLDIIFTRSSSGGHLPSCLRQCTEASGRISCGSPRDGGHGS